MLSLHNQDTWENPLLTVLNLVNHRDVEWRC